MNWQRNHLARNAIKTMIPLRLAHDRRRWISDLVIRLLSLMTIIPVSIDCVVVTWLTVITEHIRTPRPESLSAKGRLEPRRLRFDSGEAEIIPQGRREREQKRGRSSLMKARIPGVQCRECLQ